MWQMLGQPVEVVARSRVRWGLLLLWSALALGALILTQPVLGSMLLALGLLCGLALALVFTGRATRRGSRGAAVMSGALVGALAYVALWVAAAETGFPGNWFGAPDAQVTAVYGEPGSTRLEVSVGTCNQEPRVTAVETGRTVRIVTNEKVPRHSSGDCMDSDVIELEQPLGNRVVVDDSTGVQIEVDQPD